jgi:hypothetical protein
MCTLLVGLIVLVRFGPDIVYAATLWLAPVADRPAAPGWLVSPPAAVRVGQPGP